LNPDSTEAGSVGAMIADEEARAAEAESDEEEIEAEIFLPPEVENDSDEVEKDSHISDEVADIDDSAGHDVGIKVASEDVADIDDALSALELPESEYDSVDSKDMTIQRLTEQLKQKDLMFQEMQTNLDAAFEAQEIELKTVVEENAKIVEDYKTRIADLVSQVGEAANAPVDVLGEFNLYAEKPKALFVERYMEEDRFRLNVDVRNVYAFASGSTDSYLPMMEQLPNLISKGMPCVLVDLTSDHYLTKMLKIEVKAGLSSTDLLRPGVEVSQFIQTAQGFEGLELIPSVVFHSIVFLTTDWIDTIVRLVNYAEGKPVIFLFDGVKDFAVCHSIHMLSQIIKTYVFIKSNPIVVRSTQSNFLFCGDNSTEFVALNYIPVVKTLLEAIGKKRKINAYPKDVKFSELLKGYPDAIAFLG
jgi:hypothetical protein